MISIDYKLSDKKIKEEYTEEEYTATIIGLFPDKIDTLCSVLKYNSKYTLYDVLLKYFQFLNKIADDEKKRFENRLINLLEKSETKKSQFQKDLFCYIVQRNITSLCVNFKCYLKHKESNFQNNEELKNVNTLLNSIFTSWRNEISKWRKNLCELLRNIKEGETNKAIKSDYCRISTNILKNWLTMTYPVLKQIYEYLGECGRKEKIAIKYDYFISFYEKFSDSKVRLNEKIIKETGYKVCPYCNIQYTYNRKATVKKDSQESSRSKVKVTAQLDHFYDKSDFPMFALCFYNLIPSCPACNHVKSSRIDSALVSPYDTENPLYKKSLFTYSLKVEDDSKDKNSFKYKIEYNEEAQELIDANDKMFNLSGAYKQHEDYANEIIEKARIYLNPKNQEMINSTFKDLNFDDDDIINCYFGNIIVENERGKFSDRSLAKLSSDLYNEVINKSNLI